MDMNMDIGNQREEWHTATLEITYAKGDLSESFTYRALVRFPGEFDQEKQDKLLEAIEIYFTDEFIMAGYEILSTEITYQNYNAAIIAVRQEDIEDPLRPVIEGIRLN